MSDNPTAYPPPPSPNVPPPPPGYPAPPPTFQAPAAPDYAEPYQNQPAPPYAAMGVAGAAGLMSQFTGRAAWSIGVGLVTIIAPFVVHWVFYVLALVGLRYGVQAITGPASAEPTGVPSQLTDIEIANARPNQAGSVRRCRSVNSATSNGPFAKPTANITANTTVIDAAKGKTAIAAALNTIAPN